MRLWNPLFWLSALFGFAGQLVVYVVGGIFFFVVNVIAGFAVGCIWLNVRLQRKHLAKRFPDAVDWYVDRILLGDTWKGILRTAYKGSVPSRDRK